jgi:hypothetical protein
MLHRRLFYALPLSFVLLLLTAKAFAAHQFSTWSTAVSLESIPGTSSDLNTAFLEGCPTLSRDGLQLYIASNRPGGVNSLDIWVAERTSPDGAFGKPVNMGGPINSPSRDFCPSLLRDGHGFLFVSDRPDGCGGADIYLTRYDPEGGWQAPVNLGCEVNSSADETGPVLVFAESGPPTLYFSSARVEAGGPGGINLYHSPMVGAWSFGPAVLVPGVNSDANDMQPYFSRNGREMVFASNRPGSQGFDIWSATRDSINAPWLTPVNLGSSVNSASNETRPSLSWDGTILLFGTNRPGVEGDSDIFYATRDQFTGP